MDSSPSFCSKTSLKRLLSFDPFHTNLSSDSLDILVACISSHKWVILQLPIVFCLQKACAPEPPIPIQDKSQRQIPVCLRCSQITSYMLFNTFLPNRVHRSTFLFVRSLRKFILICLYPLQWAITTNPKHGSYSSQYLNTFYI